jgi:hypothetical protein
MDLRIWIHTKMSWIRNTVRGAIRNLVFIASVYVIGEAFSHQKRTSSTSKHEISHFFLLLWVIFALQDPDSESASGYGFTDLVESGSNPDPKHWKLHRQITEKNAAFCVQHCLVRSLPRPICNRLLFRRKYIFSVHEVATRQVTISGSNRIRIKNYYFLFKTRRDFAKIV